MKIDKSDKDLWDIDIDNILYEIAFSLNVKRINNLNKKLEKEGNNIRAANCELSYFIENIDKYPDLLNQSKIILRRYKIKKIKENNG